MKRYLRLFLLVVLVAGCCHKQGITWTEQEKELIMADSTCLRVLKVDDRKDSLVLREVSLNLTPQDISADVYKSLAAKLVNTVTSPEQDGVGIAGPQVGILRRVVAVMRYDKEGYPFEVYPNIRITDKRGEKEIGPEGCLSLPDRRGLISRYQDITIQYTSPSTLQDTSETVQGFTAVIFQHECDHLDGILFTDLQ